MLEVTYNRNVILFNEIRVVIKVGAITAAIDDTSSG